MTDPSLVFIAYSRTVRTFAGIMCERPLQPYEALAYQQLCRTVQTWALATEDQVKRENDDKSTDAADS